jgi:hypothetical protein
MEDGNRDHTWTIEELVKNATSATIGWYTAAFWLSVFGLFGLPRRLYSITFFPANGHEGDHCPFL